MKTDYNGTSTNFYDLHRNIYIVIDCNLKGLCGNCTLKQIGIIGLISACTVYVHAKRDLLVYIH